MRDADWVNGMLDDAVYLVTQLSFDERQAFLDACVDAALIAKMSKRVEERSQKPKQIYSHPQSDVSNFPEKSPSNSSFA